MCVYGAVIMRSLETQICIYDVQCFRLGRKSVLRKFDGDATAWLVTSRLSLKTHIVGVLIGLFPENVLCLNFLNIHLYFRKLC